MNREQEINEFLKKIAKIYKQNPELQITNDSIYYYLMKYDCNSEELKERSIKDNFEKWIDRFKNNKNINVYHTEMQNRFLQFSSPKYANPRCIKLYLSFPKDKIYECVNKIFDYISSNNMSTVSKVADIIRADAVVIRLDNEENARKVINFVNSDLYLSSNAKKTNPFLLKQGCVGIAYDHMLSYNTVVSMLLEFYFKYCRINNRFDEVSLETFREYSHSFIIQYLIINKI